MTATSSAAYKLRRFGAGVAFYAIILGFCTAVLFPVYWMIVNSIQPLSLGMQFPPPLFPKEISFLPFTTLFENFPVARWLVNSLLLAGMTTLIVLALAVLGSFAMTFLRWRGKAAFRLAAADDPDAARGAGGHSGLRDVSQPRPVGQPAGPVAGGRGLHPADLHLDPEELLRFDHRGNL